MRLATAEKIRLIDEPICADNRSRVLSANNRHLPRFKAVEAVARGAGHTMIQGVGLDGKITVVMPLHQNPERTHSGGYYFVENLLVVLRSVKFMGRPYDFFDVSGEPAGVRTLPVTRRHS